MSPFFLCTYGKSLMTIFCLQFDMKAAIFFVDSTKRYNSSKSLCAFLVHLSLPTLSFEPTLKRTLFCRCAKVMYMHSCECMRTLICGPRAKVRGLKGRVRICGSKYNQFQRLLFAPVSLRQRPPTGVRFNLQTHHRDQQHSHPGL